jgi:hypothetical protein
MAKLLSTANWPDNGQTYPEYPVEVAVNFENPNKDKAPEPSDWINFTLTVYLQSKADEDKSVLFEGAGQILRRDVGRLSTDIKSLVQQPQAGTMTFVPVAPSFELWLQHLSDEQYRVIIWYDLLNVFTGAGDIAHRGVRYTTNRARLMGFSRSLDSDMQA